MLLDLLARIGPTASALLWLAIVGLAVVLADAILSTIKSNFPGA